MNRVNFAFTRRSGSIWRIKNFLSKFIINQSNCSIFPVVRFIIAATNQSTRYHFGSLLTAIMDRTTWKMLQFDWLMMNSDENVLKILDFLRIFFDYLETKKSECEFLLRSTLVFLKVSTYISDITGSRGP